jgi:hypothetical protein
MARYLVPPMQGPIPHAGGWGLPGPGIGRPQTAPPESFGGRIQVALRGGEGTRSGIVPASGIVSLSIGPDGTNIWYPAYAALSTTTGALDSSTAQFKVGPYSQGIVPGGQSYSGGGDTIGLAGTRMAAGDYLTVVWTGATPGDAAMLTLVGTQDIPV